MEILLEVIFSSIIFKAHVEAKEELITSSRVDNNFNNANLDEKPQQVI